MIYGRRAKTCVRCRRFVSSVSVRLRSFVRKIRNATSFYRLPNDSISWLQPLDSSV